MSSDTTFKCNVVPPIPSPVLPMRNPRTCTLKRTYHLSPSPSESESESESPPQALSTEENTAAYAELRAWLGGMETVDRKKWNGEAKERARLLRGIYSACVRLEWPVCVRFGGVEGCEEWVGKREENGRGRGLFCREWEREVGVRKREMEERRNEEEESEEDPDQEETIVVDCGRGGNGRVGEREGKVVRGRCGRRYALVEYVCVVI